MHLDEELLRRFLIEGDEFAFDRLVQRHGRMVLHMCRSILGNMEDAEDAAQSTFLVLYKRAAKLKKGGGAAPWLRHVAMCIARNMRKSREARRCCEAASAQNRQAAQSRVDERYIHLHEAIGRLPSRHQHVIVCFYLEGATRQEIAAGLGCSENTVKHLLRRGRQRLPHRTLWADKLSDELRRGQGWRRTVNLEPLNHAKWISSPLG